MNQIRIAIILLSGIVFGQISIDSAYSHLIYESNPKETYQFIGKITKFNSKLMVKKDGKLMVTENIFIHPKRETQRFLLIRELA